MWRGTCNVIMRTEFAIDEIFDIMILSNFIVLVDGMRFILLKMVGRLRAGKV